MTALPHLAWDGFLLGPSGKSRSSLDIIRRLESGLFKQQLAVLRDPSDRKAVLCTRRSGKTHRIAVNRLITMERFPGHNAWSGYATLTKGQSRQNLDGVLRELISEHDLPVTPGEVDGQIVFRHENGHRLWLGGVDDMRKAERRRGNKWYEFELDEGGAWPAEIMRYFVDSIVDPALSDTGGALTINGTPGLLESGYFYEITTPGDTLPTGKRKMPQWSTHKWSVVDNPHHVFGKPGGREKLEAMRIAKGWDHDHPTWRREWCGEWATDTDLLIYRYDGTRNASFEVPTGDLKWALGVDVGHDDDTAFVLACNPIGTPYVHIIRAWGAPGMTQPQRAQEMMRIKQAIAQRYNTRVLISFDQGGLGKAIAFDLQQTYGVASQPAEKHDKAAAIRAVRDGLTSGRILACPFSPSAEDPIGLGASQLLSEWAGLPWDDDRKDHHERYADHCADAFLYAFRALRPRETWDEVPPEPGTREAIDKAQRERKHRLGKRAAIMRDESLSPAQRRAKLRREGLG